MRFPLIFAGLGLAVASLCAAAPQEAVAPPMASGDSIMVLPFVTAPGSKNTWIGKAIQQSLFTDLVQRSRAHAVAPQGEPPANQNDALCAGATEKSPWWFSAMCRSRELMSASPGRFST